MQIIETLREYVPYNDNERESIKQTISWIEKYNKNAFVRENLDWHITGSMLIVDPTLKYVLLMHHKKLNKWLQFGWHSDGNIDSKEVAIREFQEESWLNIVPWNIVLFDVDDHIIPARWNEPNHIHFDILFLWTIPFDSQFHKQDLEVNDIKWFSIEDAREANDSYRMKRLLDKIEL